MKIGFLTGVLGNLDFERLVKWASGVGFKALEVSAHPGSRHIDPRRIVEYGVGDVKKVLEGADVAISSLAHYPNNLDPNLEVRRRNVDYLKVMVDACVKLDVSVVCTAVGSPGRVWDVGVDKAIAVYSEVFGPMADYAEAHQVKIAFENWPGGGWNLAYSPEMWLRMFNALPSKALGLNFDPSHLVWQQIDYIGAVKRFGDRVYHTHAKDTEIHYQTLADVGIYGGGWWRYRIPGWGEIDWASYITALREVKYGYVLSIEHEDPTLGAEDGLKLGLRFLSNLLP